MKRIVMAVIISAMMYAATAVLTTSCTWMDDVWATYNEGKDQAETPVIPMDKVLRVEEFIAGGFSGDTLWVKGVIVGGLASDGSIDFGCEGEVMEKCVVLADDKDCDDPDACLVLQMTKKAHKEVLDVSGANKSKVLHRTLYIRGKATTYKNHPSLTNLSDYKLE